MTGYSGAVRDGWQSRSRRFVGAFGMLSVLSAMVIGCNQGPPRIDAPDWDPPELAERILEELDKNGDASVDAPEWSASPGLAAGARFVDKDKDGRLSREELEARFEIYRKYLVGLRPQVFRVTYKGRPVSEAELVFRPEPFLDGVIEPAHGTTDQDGMVTPQTEGQELPGMRPGYYRVQVASARIKIPAKYIDAETLGAEASPVNDDPFGPGGPPELRLTD